MPGIAKKLLWIGYAVLLAAAATAAFYAFRTPADGISAAERRRIEAEVIRRMADYRRQISGIEAQFERELRDALPADFLAARQSADAAADRLSSYGSCLKLSYKLAKDRFTGGSEAESAIHAVIQETVLAECVSARRRAEDILARHLRLLLEADAAFRGGLAAAWRDAALPEPKRNSLAALGADMAKSEELAAGLAADNAWATAGTAIEAVLLKTTVRLIGSALSKAAARLAAGAGSAAVAAAADGPLPVGDCVGAVIGAGGLGWTAYDIYQARKTMPDLLRRELNAAVDGCRNRTAGEILNSGRAAAADCAAAAGEYERNLINQLRNRR